MTNGPGDAAIRLDSVHLALGGRPILEGLSCDIAAGETLALVGRSGSGKSSTLKLINRMLLPDRGRIIVGGRDTAAWDPYALRRSIGYVFQEIALFPHLTIERNVAIVPRLLGWEPGRTARRVDDLLALVGLSAGEHGTRWPHELSGGQRQRVGVARALAADPPVLLMDEPFGALDPVTRAGMHAEFARLQAQLGKTIVLVTHDMAEALALGSRVGVLAGGRLIALDTPAAIVRSPHPEVRAMLEPLVRASQALGGSAS